MMMRSIVTCLWLTVGQAFGQLAMAAEPLLRHQLTVDLNPREGSLEVRNVIRLNPGASAEFSLHPGLNPETSTRGVILQKLDTENVDARLEHFRITLPEGVDSFELEYSGRIVHEFSQRTESPGRRQSLVDGTISEQGVFLSSAVAWYPVFRDALLVFDMEVNLPEGWMAVSQGGGPQSFDGNSNPVAIHWSSQQPQETIYLIAGPYSLYREQQGEIEAQVYLRKPDPALANRYLKATRKYIDIYSDLIGAYPYPKFALVENFWETGYGMPSFTLLGSRVIRLPFILHSSYPHEILHNWWGNSVYVDYTRGNWSEGLTAYLADHLIKEQSGQGVSHRRNSLQRFAAFVRGDNDFALTQFRSRHSGGSQAVGYDKAMMMFHMLRRKVGDTQFIAGLRQFYLTNAFHRVSYPQLQKAFEQVSKMDLSGFFQQWTERTGMPAIEIANYRMKPRGDGYVVELELTQTQPEDTFEMDIPLLIFAEGSPTPVRTVLNMRQRKQWFTIPTRGKPQRLELDPGLDVFRRLHASESPPVLSELFGSEAVLFVLPAQAEPLLLATYRKMAEEWAEGYKQADIRLDQEIKELPANTRIWLLGWQNQHAVEVLQTLPTQDFDTGADRIRLAGRDFARMENSFVLNKRLPNGSSVGWIATDNPVAIPGLTRKLPHYGRYSYLAFTGDQPGIQHKGQWPVRDSALSITFGSDEIFTRPPLAPLWLPSQ